MPAQLNALVSALPYLEVAHFPAVGGYKWSTSDVKKYSEGLAAGYAELDFKAGDVMALWLPKDGPEAFICKFAAARLGMQVVEIDMTEADPEAIKKVLLASKAKTLVFDPEAEDRYNVDLLQKIMPEMECYNAEFGAVFRTRALPHLKLMVHTGIDKLNCAANLKFLLVTEPRWNLLPPVPAEDSAVVAANLATPAWACVSAVLAKKHMKY